MKGRVTISLDDYEELKEGSDKMLNYTSTLLYTKTKIEMLLEDIPVRDLNKLEIKSELTKILRAIGEDI